MVGKQRLTGVLFPALILGTPAVSFSRSNWRGGKQVVALSEKSEIEIREEPFAIFGEEKREALSEERDVLSFLKSEGLLESSGERSSRKSGEQSEDGRKEFAGGKCVYTWATAFSASYGQASCTGSKQWIIGPPSIKTSSISSITSSSFSLTVTANLSANGYAVLLLRTATKPSIAQVKAGQDGAGNSAVATKTWTNQTTTTESFTGVSGADENKYVVYFIVSDSDGDSDVESHAILSTSSFSTIGVGGGKWSNPDIEKDSSGNIFTSTEYGGTISIKKWNGSTFSNYASKSIGTRHDMVVSSDGDIHIMYDDYGPSNMANDNYPAYYKYSGSWSSKIRVKSGTPGLESQTKSLDFLFADSSNNIHALFKLYDSSSLYYAKKPSGSNTWTTTSIGSTSEEDYTFVLVDSSDVYAVYYTGSSIVMKKSNDGFSSSSTESPSVSSVLSMDVYMDSNGDIHLVYTTGTASYGVPTYAYYMKYSSGSWSSPEEIPTTGFERVSAQKVRFDGSTVYVLMYNSIEGLYYFVKKESGKWTEGVFISKRSMMSNDFVVDGTNSKIFLMYEDYSSGGGYVIVEDIDTLIPPQASTDSDANLIAGTTVDESSMISISSTVDTESEKVNLFDFTISDGGTSDGLPTDITDIVINTSGTADFSKVAWLLNGSNATNIMGVYSSSSNRITFSGLSISVADGGNETYSISGYFNDNTGLIDNSTFGLSIDGDSDITVDTSKTTFGVTDAVTNNLNTKVDITATKLRFIIMPNR